MIALGKANRLNWLALGTPQLFFTASHKKSLSDIAQRAVWASSIITLIKDANKFYQSSKPLPKLIDQLKIPSNKYHFGQEIEEEVKAMFSKGVKLRPEFKVQQPFLQGSHYASGFVFRPNYTVTQPIFECLTNFRRNYYICGEYGISKTISFALYQHLSPYIHRFIFQSQRNKQLTSELQNLTKEGLIEIYPKCWYWSIGQKKFTEPKNMMIQIIDKAIELPQKRKKMLRQAQSQEQLSKILMKIYENASIQRIIIIDQIHQAASRIRAWNLQSEVWDKQIKKLRLSRRKIEQYYEIEARYAQTFEEKLELLYKQYAELSKIDQPLKLQYQKKYQQNPIKSNIYDQADKTIQQIQRFGQFGAFHIYASSVNFERKILLDRPQEGSSKLGLQINKNQRTIREMHINFSKAIKQQIGKADFINFFVFEVKRRIAISTIIPEEAFDKWESLFRAKVANIPLKGYYRIIFIRQYLFDKITLILSKKAQSSFKAAHNSSENTSICEVCDFKLEEGTSPQILKFYAIGLKEDKQMDLFESFEVYCRERCQNKLRTFLETQNQKKLALLHVLYRHAEAAKKFKYTTFDLHTQAYNKILDCSAQQLLLDNYHNKELLPIEYSDKIITFHWTPEEFMQLAEKFVKDRLLQFYDVYLNGYFALHFQRSKIGLGSIFQFAVMQLLNPNADVQFLLANEKGDFTPKNFDILDKRIFISFYKPDDSNSNHIKASFSIKQNLFHVLKLAEQNQGKYIAGETHVCTYKSLQFDAQSPTIDFVIVRYSEKKHDIFTFDVATSKDQSNIKEKMAAAVTFFTDLTQDSSFEKEKYFIQHVILCKQDLCLPEKKQPNFSITCSPYELLDASNVAQEYLHKYLYFHAFRKAVVDNNLDLEDPLLTDGRLNLLPSKR